MTQRVAVSELKPGDHVTACGDAVVSVARSPEPGCVRLALRTVHLDLPGDAIVTAGEGSPGSWTGLDRLLNEVAFSVHVFHGDPGRLRAALMPGEGVAA